MKEVFDFLKLKVIRFDHGIITFKIAEQLFRQDRFFNGNHFYSATNGVTIYSSLMPEVKSYGFLLYVRGKEQSADDIELTTDLGFYLKLLKAVKEYNISMNKEIYKY